MKIKTLLSDWRCRFSGQYLILFCLPVGLFLFREFVAEVRGPYYFGYNLDPEYAYLLNSLNILIGKVPAHFDHPGTPLQLLGAVVIGFLHLSRYILGFTDSLIDDVLKNAEFFLTGINLCLLAITAFVLLLVGWRTAKLTGSVLKGLFLQALSFLFFPMEIALARPTPEILLVAATLGLVYILMPMLVEALKGNRVAPDPLWMAAVLAFGFGTKITFAPLFLVVLFLADFKAVKKVIYSLPLFFVFFTWPISSRYGDMFNWFKRLAIHSDHYGSGEIGLPSANSLWMNTKSLFFDAPLVYISILICIVLFFLMSKGSRLRLFFFVSATLILCQLIMTTKHPGIHYLLPSMIFIGLVIWTSFFALKSVPLKWLLGSIVCTCFFYNNFLRLSQELRQSREQSAELFEMQKFLEDSKCQVAGFYRTSSLQYALQFGDDFAGKNFNLDLQRIFGHQIFFDIFNRSFTDFKGNLTYEQARRSPGNCVILYGTTMNEDRKEYFKMFNLTPLKIGRYESAYLVNTMATE